MFIDNLPQTCWVGVLEQVPIVTHLWQGEDVSELQKIQACICAEGDQTVMDPKTNYGQCGIHETVLTFDSLHKRNVPKA